MNWDSLEIKLQPLLAPRRLDVWRVRLARRAWVQEAKVSPSGPRRMFLDVSVTSRQDAGTGIQRVVRAVTSQLMLQSPEGWEIVPVGATRKHPYHRITWPDAQPPADLSPIEARPGDVFLGLDLALDTTRTHEKQLRQFKHQGGRLCFVMYDLLPVERPDWFSDKLALRFRKWLRVLAAHADDFYCISSVVEADLRQTLAQRYGLVSGYRTHVLPMGGDLANSRPSTGLPADFSALLERLAACPTALMVGTLEPRKGHAEILAAFEALWAANSKCNLLIVGRPGWRTVALQQALRQHAEHGKHLFWLDDASDEALEKLYAASNGVIVASLAEGFGLPLIEALVQGKPVLARDLPIFRAHEAKGVQYFAGGATPDVTGRLIYRWLMAGHMAPALADLGLSSWAEAAGAIMASQQKGVV